MKKRAVISTAIGALLAGAACLGFAACNDDTAESVKSVEVDEETWNAAFGETLFEDYKIELETVETEKTEQFVYVRKTTVTAKIKGGLQYIETVRNNALDGEVPEAQKDYYPVGEVSYEYYVDYSNRVIVAERDGEWVSVTPDRETAGRYVPVQYMIEILFGDAEYGHYEYSEEHKGYVAKDADEGNAVVYKFRDGKLRAVLMSVTTETEKEEIKASYSALFSFGGQEVTLPALSE